MVYHIILWPYEYDITILLLYVTKLKYLSDCWAADVIHIHY